jgi:hypothetical protein
MVFLVCIILYAMISLKCVIASATVGSSNCDIYMYISSIFVDCMCNRFYVKL